MRVLVSLEHRFQRTPDGRVWTATSHSYTFFQRYLEVFDQVDVLARVLDVAEAEPDWIRADGTGIRVLPVPHFVGPNEYAKRVFAVRRAIRRHSAEAEAVIMRVPSLIGQNLDDALKESGHPLGLEVVADPFDVYAPQSGVRHPLRPFFRRWFASNLRRQCRQAKAVAYVTRSALQSRYPSSATMMGISDVMLPESAFVTSYSSVELAAEQILAADQRRPPRGGRSVLVFVGTLEQLYKAPDDLIKATAQVVAKGCDVELKIVGDGRYKASLQELARSLGIADRCQFLGQLPSGAAVQEVLDKSDVFVLPSRVEGLPRAMIEAMARRLPCIGSQIGGIPELLDDEFLVPPGNVDALAQKIVELVSNPARQAAAAERNVREAKQYCDDLLRLRRLEFYNCVRDFTADWLQMRSSRGAARSSVEPTKTSKQEQGPAVNEALRILSVVTRFGAGGPPLAVLQMARGMEKYGYQTLIATGSCSAQDADMSYLLTEQDKVEWVPSMSRNVAAGADFVALWQLIRLVRKYRPDIIHTHTAKAGVLGRLAGWVNGTPLIVHTFHGNVLRGYFSAFGSWCVQKIEQLFGAMSDALFVISRQQQHEIADEFSIADPQKVRILPLGLPLKEFENLPPPPVGRKELVVAWFGRLVAVKNVPLLVQIVEQSLQAIPNIRFVIAGDGPERAAVKNLVERSAGRVEYLGWQREVGPIIGRADVLIQTSINEGTPIILIQGMAAARPFVSTAVGGVGDMVVGEERPNDTAKWFGNGVLVPQNAAPFVTVLRTFAQNRALLSQMGLVGRQWSLANYAESKMLEATHQLYSEYLSAKGHRLPPPLPPKLAGQVSMTQQLSCLAEQTGPLHQTGLENKSQR
jgi:glycosyltransferase involved in cell wall biosynthesis